MLSMPRYWKNECLTCSPPIKISKIDNPAPVVIVNQLTTTNYLWLSKQHAYKLKLILTAITIKEEYRKREKEKMMQATLSDSNYSDAKSLLVWGDGRAAEFAAAEKKKKKEEEANLLLR